MSSLDPGFERVFVEQYVRVPELGVEQPFSLSWKLLRPPSGWGAVDSVGRSRRNQAEILTTPAWQLALTNDSERFRELARFGTMKESELGAELYMHKQICDATWGRGLTRRRRRARRVRRIYLNTLLDYGEAVPDAWGWLRHYLKGYAYNNYLPTSALRIVRLPEVR